MVKYKEFIREKLQKLNNLPKKWQQVIICILVIIVAIIYCFSGGEKTKIAVSEKVENKNTIISANGEDEEKNKNSKMIYSMDKDISTIKNPFSFEHEEKSDSKIMTTEEKQKDKVNTNNENIEIKTHLFLLKMVGLKIQMIIAQKVFKLPTIIPPQLKNTAKLDIFN